MREGIPFNVTLKHYRAYCKNRESLFLNTGKLIRIQMFSQK